MHSSESDARKALPLAAIITFIGFLDTHLLIPVLSIYAAELEASTMMVRLIVGLYSLVNTPANIVFGRLVDRVGKKLPLVVGLLGDAAAMFLYSLTRTPLHLVLLRLWHGLMGGMVGPATMSVIAESDETDRARAMGFYGMAIAAATLMGYGLSGVTASRLGYNAVFYVGAGVLIGGVFLSMLLPADRERHGVAGPRYTRGNLKTLLGRRGLVVSYYSVFAQYFTFGGVVTLLPLHVRALGMEALHAGILLAIFAVLFIVVQFSAGIISSRAGRGTPVIIGQALAVAVLLLMPMGNSLYWLMAVMGLYGIAYGLLFPPIAAMVAEHSEPGERGLASGIFHALLTVGVAVGAPVIGWVGATFGIEAGLLINSTIMAMALVATTFLKRNV